MDEQREPIRSVVYRGPSGSLTLADGSGPFKQGRRIALSRRDQLVLARQGLQFSDVIEDTDPAMLVEPEPPAPEPEPEPLSSPADEAEATPEPAEGEERSAP